MALDDPKTIRKLWIGFTVVLVILVVLDPKLHELIGLREHDPHHGAHFVVDGWPEFYAIYGFVACCLMVFGSKLVIGKILMRPDDYYDRSPLDPTRDAKGRRLRA